MAVTLEGGAGTGGATVDGVSGCGGRVLHALNRTALTLNKNAVAIHAGRSLCSEHEPVKANCSAAMKRARA